MCIAVTANAQSISNAWNSAPSNCDTGCAQSGLVGVTGNNSGTQDGATVVFQGSFTGSKSFTVTRHALVSVNLSTVAESATVSVSGANGDGCSNLSSQTKTGAMVTVWGSLYAGGTCFVLPGTYTARALGTNGNSATAALMVVELP